MQVGRLSCCDQGAKFVGLRHESALFYDRSYKTAEEFLAHMRATPPLWTMHAESFATRWYRTDKVSVRVSFCPFCGVKTPDVRLRKKPPTKICVVIDSGYYCDTCTKRLNECQCHLPERLWEAAPCTG
jgi:hypothetical protein